MFLTPYEFYTTIFVLSRFNGGYVTQSSDELLFGRTGKGRATGLIACECILL